MMLRARSTLNRRLFHLRGVSTVVAHARGRPEDANEPLYFVDEASAQALASPWHDVPLVGGSGAGTAVHAVCASPRGSTVPSRCAVGVAHNPLVFVPGFTGIATIVNHCFLPQTFMPHLVAGAGGPLAVCELGTGVAKRGEVYSVSVIGAVAVPGVLGTPEWHVMAVRANARAPVDLAAGDSHLPPLLAQLAADVRHWLNVQPVAAGRGAMRGEVAPWASRAEALALVASAHAQWRALMDRPRQTTRYGLEGASAAEEWLPPPHAGR